MEPTIPALEGGFWTTGAPGKSLIWLSLIPAARDARRRRGQFPGRLNMPPGWRELEGLRRQHRLQVEPKFLVLLKGRLDFSPQFLWIFHLNHFAADWQGYEHSPGHMSGKSLAPRWAGQSLIQSKLELIHSGFPQYLGSETLNLGFPAEDSSWSLEIKQFKCRGWNCSEKKAGVKHLSTMMGVSHQEIEMGRTLFYKLTSNQSGWRHL